MSVQDLFEGPELVPGTLRLYRSWSSATPCPCGCDIFQPDGGLLRSTGVPYWWKTREVVAECHADRMTVQFSPGMSEEHSSPHKDCKCGLWGWYHPDDDRLAGGHYFGVIEASGRVIMGEHGARAEKAKVLGVVMDRADPSAPRLVEAGVPLYPSREALLAAFPPDDVTELVGHECSPECLSRASGGGLWSVMAQGLTYAFQRYTPPSPPVDLQKLTDALMKLSAAAWSGNSISIGKDEEPETDVFERAMRLKRERNTGPSWDPQRRLGKG